MRFIIRWSIHLAVCGSLLLSACAKTQKLETSVAVAPARVSAESGRVASLPAEIFLGGIFLQASVNNSQPLWFVLDSGSSFDFIIDEQQAKKLRLEFRGNDTSTGAGENTYNVALADNVRVALFDVKFPAQTVSIIALDSLEPFAGRSLDGVVGFGLFSRYVVEIDYAARRVNLYNPQSYHYSGSGTRLPLAVEEEHFFTRAKVTMPERGEIEAQLLIDTGAVMTTIILNRPFVEKHNLLPTAGKKFLDRSFPGLGGETKQILSRATVVQLGALNIQKPTVTLSQDAQGALASSDYDGIIGGELLRRFKVIFDAAHNQLILEPNTFFSEPYEHNMSGIGLHAEGENFKTFKVHRIIENSPASEAGLREGDEIITIGGQPASSFTVEQLYQMFKQENREYDLNIIRSKEKLQVKMKLRHLI